MYFGDESAGSLTNFNKFDLGQLGQVLINQMHFVYQESKIHMFATISSSDLRYAIIDISNLPSIGLVVNKYFS